MSDLLDKHSEDYDPDAFTALVDSERKRLKEDGLAAVLPPRLPLHNAFTGELLDRDDLPSLKAALAEIEEFLAGFHRRHRALYMTRDELKARIGELEPLDLPRRANQTERQAKLDRCPRCRTRLPRVVFTEALDSEPQAGHSSSQTPTAPVSAADLDTTEQPSESKKLAAAPSAVGAEAPVPPQKQAPSPPAGDVPDGASPALPLEKP